MKKANSKAVTRLNFGKDLCPRLLTEWDLAEIDREHSYEIAQAAWESDVRAGWDEETEEEDE